MIRRSRVLGLSFAVTLLGAVSLHGEEAQEEGGFCVWTLGTSQTCENYDLIEECEYHVFNECHNENWVVTSATCTGGSQQIKCKASWQGS